MIAVLNGSGKLVMESIVETKASSILQFIHGLRGELHVTWEEGTWAAWLSRGTVTRNSMCSLLVPSSVASASSSEQGVGLAIENAVSLLDGGLADGLRQVTVAGAGRSRNMMHIILSSQRCFTVGIRSTASPCAYGDG